MTSRDTYPHLAELEADGDIEARFALDEIDRLRAIADAAQNLELATHLIGKEN